MTKKALEVNELMCDNNTVKTHHVNRSDLKKKLAFSKRSVFSPIAIYLYMCVCLYNIYYVYVCVCIYIYCIT